MGNVLGALLAGFFLRCPRCKRGHLFQHGFTMYPACPNCGLPFETSAGEMTGGMGVNISVTLLLTMAASMYFGLNRDFELVPLLVALGMCVVVFPIAFHRSARGLWVAILYLTGANRESD